MKNLKEWGAAAFGAGVVIVIIFCSWRSAAMALSMYNLILFFMYAERRDNTFEELEERRWKWAKKIFPQATAHSSLIKASGEIKETEELLRMKMGFVGTDMVLNEDLIEEYADVLMCVFDSARRAGITPDQLKLGYHKKTEKNIARKWTKNADNTYSHVKS